MLLAASCIVANACELVLRWILCMGAWLFLRQLASWRPLDVSACLGCVNAAAAVAAGHSPYHTVTIVQLDEFLIVPQP